MLGVEGCCDMLEWWVLSGANSLCPKSRTSPCCGVLEFKLSTGAPLAPPSSAISGRAGGELVFVLAIMALTGVFEVFDGLETLILVVIALIVEC
jgi:hypothetical protein